MSVLLRRYYQLLNGSLGRWLDSKTINAIQTAFGSDGAAIIKATHAYLTDLARTDQTKAIALAGFINEDPMMVCSLGLQPQGVTMPIRWLVGDGTAYINTRLVPTSAMNYRLVGKDSYLTARSFAGSRNVIYSGILFGAAGIDYFPTNPSLSARWVFNQPTAWSRVEYVIKEGVARVYTNGTLLGEHTFTDYGGTTTGALYLFEINNNGAHGAYIAGMSIALFEIENFREMYPFIRQGVNGMIDILSGTFYSSADTSGSFTIEYTLPDGTPWTPSTQTS